MFSTLLSGDNGGGNEGGGGSDSIVDNYLTLEALEDGFTAKLSKKACEYCVDGDGVWLPLPAATDTPAINAGQTLSFRANTAIECGTFTLSKNCRAMGNAMSLLYGDDAADNFTMVADGFADLFRNATKLISVSASFLPATILAANCYEATFYGCSNLESAPHIPNCKLANYCMSNMFRGCKKLTYIKAMFTEKPNASIPRTSNWVNGVASSGTFVKNAAATWDLVGASGVPSGWTIEYATE